MRGWGLHRKQKLVAVSTSCSKGSSGRGLCVTASESLLHCTLLLPRAACEPVRRAGVCGGGSGPTPWGAVFLRHSGEESHGDSRPCLSLSEMGPLSPLRLQ